MRVIECARCLFIFWLVSQTFFFFLFFFYLKHQEQMFNFQCRHICSQVVFQYFLILERDFRPVICQWPDDVSRVETFGQV